MINIRKLSLTTEKVIEKSKFIHGDRYDYSLVDYTGTNNKIIIICKKHGEFYQNPSNHYNLKQGCPKCAGVGKDTKQFIEEAEQIHLFKYNYSKVKYVNHTKKVEILCNEHGLFFQQPRGHLEGQGCPRCRISKGEIIIENYLKKNNIIFESQKTFDDCKLKAKLRFDFYLPQYNTVIEYHGIQHYVPQKFFGGEDKFKEIKFKDKFKKAFCIQNNILYIELNKDNISNIENII